VQLKDAAEKVGRKILDLLLLLRRGLLLLLLSTFRLLQYRSTVAGALRNFFFPFVMMTKLFVLPGIEVCVSLLLILLCKLGNICNNALNK
jgi:hypothetical protein